MKRADRLVEKPKILRLVDQRGVGCRTSFTGLGIGQPGYPAVYGLWSKTDRFENSLGPGTYRSTGSACPNAVMATFDAFAIDFTTRLKVLRNGTGGSGFDHSIASVVFDGIGPFILTNRRNPGSRPKPYMKGYVYPNGSKKVIPGAEGLWRSLGFYKDGQFLWSNEDMQRWPNSTWLWVNCGESEYERYGEDDGLIPAGFESGDLSQMPDDYCYTLSGSRPVSCGCYWKTSDVGRFGKYEVLLNEDELPQERSAEFDNEFGVIEGTIEYPIWGMEGEQAIDIRYWNAFPAGVLTVRRASDGKLFKTNSLKPGKEASPLAGIDYTWQVSYGWVK